MPRRALFWITATVVWLHWLVLGGVPHTWTPATQPQQRSSNPTTQIFSTRTLPAPPVEQPAVAAAPTVDPVATAPPTPTKTRAAAPARVRPARDTARVQPPVAPSDTTTLRSETPLGDDLVAPEFSDPALGPPAVGAASQDTGNRDAGSAASTAPADVANALNDASPPAATANSVNPLDANGLAPVASASAPHAPTRPETAAGVDIQLPSGPLQRDGQSLAVQIPDPTRLSFDVNGQAKKFTYHASAELIWQHDGSRYEARQEISAFLIGKRTQRSQGQITRQGLVPERFSDKSRSEQAAHFNAQTGRATFSANTPSADVGGEAQDRLSVFIQLGALLGANTERLVPGSQITLTTVSARSADRWTFTIEGPETLELPVGPTATIKLQRLPRKEYDQRAELWVAPSLGYLPVRIQLTQANGDFADLQLRSTSVP